MENRLACVFVILAIFFVQQIICRERSGGIVRAGFDFTRSENFPVNLTRLVSFRLPSNGIEILVKDVETDEPIENASILGSVASSRPTSLELRTNRDGKAFLKVSRRENHDLDIAVSASSYAKTSWKGRVPPENRRIVVYMYYDPFRAWMNNSFLSFSRSYSSQHNRLGWYFDYRWKHVKNIESWAAPFYENKPGWRLENYWAADVYHWEIIGWQNAQEYTWVKTASGIEYYPSFGTYYEKNVGSEFYPPESDGTWKYVITAKRIDTIGGDTRQIAPVLPGGYSYFYPPWTGGHDRNLNRTPVTITVRADINRYGNPADCFSLALNLYMKAVENGNNPTTFEGSQTFTVHVNHIVANGFSNGWRIDDVRIGNASVLGQSSFATITDYGNLWHTAYPSGPVYYFLVFGENSLTSNDAPRMRAYYRNMTVYLKKIRYVFVVDRYDWMLENRWVPVYGWVYQGEQAFTSPPQNTNEYRYENVRIKYRVYRHYVDAYENILETYYYLPYPTKYENLYVVRLNGYADNLLLGTSLLSGENVTLWIDNARTVPVMIELYDADVWTYTVVGRRIAFNEWVSSGEDVLVNGEDVYRSGVGAGDLFVDEDGLRLFGIKEIYLRRSDYLGVDGLCWKVGPPINAIRAKFALENSKLVITVFLNPQEPQRRVVVLENVADIPFSDIRLLTGREFTFPINLRENINAWGSSYDNILRLDWEYDPNSGYLTIWGPETTMKIGYYRIVERKDYPRNPGGCPDDYPRFPVSDVDSGDQPSIVFLTDVYNWAYRPTTVYTYDWVHAGRWIGLSSRPENSKRFKFENVTPYRRTENACVFRLAFYPRGASFLRFSVMDNVMRRFENIPFEIKTSDPFLPPDSQYFLYYGSRALGPDVQENSSSPPQQSEDIIVRQKRYCVSQTYAAIKYVPWVPPGVKIVEDYHLKILNLIDGYELVIDNIGVAPKGSFFRAWVENIDPAFRLVINWEKKNETVTHDVYTLRLIQLSPVDVPYRDFTYVVRLQSYTSTEVLHTENLFISVSSKIRVVAVVHERGPYFILPIVLVIVHP